MVAFLAHLYLYAWSERNFFPCTYDTIWKVKILMKPFFSFILWYLCIKDISTMNIKTDLYSLLYSFSKHRISFYQLSHFIVFSSILKKNLFRFSENCLCDIIYQTKLLTVSGFRFYNVQFIFVLKGSIVQSLYSKTHHTQLIIWQPKFIKPPISINKMFSF